MLGIIALVLAVLIPTLLKAKSGSIGEILTGRELKLVSLLGRKGKILRNIYLPKDDGTTSEVDVIYITVKGIFIFESKNYSGWIFGNEYNGYWTAVLPNKQRNSFYNPIHQNKIHLKWMQSFVGNDIPLFSVVVFSNRCELKDVTVVSDVSVIKRERVYSTIRDIWKRSPDVLSDERVDELYESLKKLTNVDKSVKKAHVENIQKKYKADKPTKSPDKIVDENRGSSNTDDMTCPNCGGNLVLRTAKQGKYAGRSFYGCSNYPRCRYIKNV